MPIALTLPSYPVSDRELAVLRVLGRFGTTLGTTLHELVCPDVHTATRARLLVRLVEQKLIWQAAIPHSNRDEQGRVRGRSPYVYGLTDDGKEALDSYNAEPHDGTYERLLSRSRKALPLSTAAILLDVYVSDWCAALLCELRQMPTLVGVHIQRRFVLAEGNGARPQTIGAVIVAAFTAGAPAPERRSWDLPWCSLTDAAAAPTTIRLALEIDTGVAAIRTFSEMAQTYQQLTEANAYPQVLGGPVRPVLVVPKRRSGAVREVWVGTWPGSPALLSTFEHLALPDRGPLRGHYLALATDPPQPTTLLGG